MINCKNCGHKIPDIAEYCPNCGESVMKKIEKDKPSLQVVLKIFQAGILGALISIMILSFSPVGLDLYFIPSFFSSIIAIYLNKPRRMDLAISIALAVYLFTDGITAGISLGTLYLQDISLAEAYGNYVPTLVDVILFTASPVSAIAAGYIGNRLTSKPQKEKYQPFNYKRRDKSGGIIFSLKN
jgi:hypothetical protein